MRFLILLYSLFVSLVSYAETELAYLNQARSAFLKEDHFQSSRYYGLLFEKTLNQLEAEDIENYIVSQSLLLPIQTFIAFCNEKSSLGFKKPEIDFYCAKTLLSLGESSVSLKFFDTVPKNYHRLEYHVLKATAFLMVGKPQFCIDESQIAQKKMTANTSNHFKDLVQVTEARCLVDLQKYDDALLKFQSVRVDSDFYLTTLEEQAWVQFKRRNVKSSREILNVIQSKILSTKSDSSIMDNMFFRVRYLQGYIDLITQNSESAKLIFQKMTSEIKKYKEANLRNTQIVSKMVLNLQNLKSKIDVESNKLLQKFHKKTVGWVSSALEKEGENSIRFLIALNYEQNRKLSFSDDYTKQIALLKKRHLSYMTDIFKETFNEYKRSLDSIHFKFSMGQIENVWAQRTEGKRTIAEALEAYGKELGGVEEYLDR